MGKIAKLKNNVDSLEAIRTRINNALNENGQDLAAALRALLDELESSEVEIDEEALAAKINELIAGAEPNSKVEEAIANAIAKRMSAIRDSMPEALSPKVKNEISAAILRSGRKEAVKNAVNDVLVRNGISGLTFENVIDYTIVESWGNLNPLFAQLKRVPYTKFFYNDDDLGEKDILAKEWTKTNETEKAIQALAATGKTIATKYVYKRQQIAFEDLDSIEAAGESTNFIRFINEELDRQIVNTCVMAILIGDTTNDAGNRLSTFETIGSKTASDVFTTISNPEGASVVLTDVRKMIDNIKNPYGQKKVLVISRKMLSQIAEFTYASGGTTTYMSDAEVAEKVGVDEVITSDLLDPEDGIYAIGMIPSEYWYNEKAALEVAYPRYENNVMNYQKERNIGGAIHGLYSTAVLKAAEDED